MGVSGPYATTATLARNRMQTPRAFSSGSCSRHRHPPTLRGPHLSHVLRPCARRARRRRRALSVLSSSRSIASPAGRSRVQGRRDRVSHRLVFVGIPLRDAVALTYAAGIMTGWLALITSRLTASLGPRSWDSHWVLEVSERGAFAGSGVRNQSPPPPHDRGGRLPRRRTGGAAARRRLRDARHVKPGLSIVGVKRVTRPSAVWKRQKVTPRPGIALQGRRVTRDPSADRHREFRAPLRPHRRR